MYKMRQSNLAIMSKKKKVNDEIPGPFLIVSKCMAHSQQVLNPYGQSQADSAPSVNPRVSNGEILPPA